MRIIARRTLRHFVESLAGHRDQPLKPIRYPMDPPDPVEAIKFRMEQQGLSRKDLEPLIGTRTRVAEVMNRRRSLSITMIRRLHDRLGISADVLIGAGTGRYDPAP
jgi:antitoxin component HigA of HigAB toxin-antitoxin module